MCKETKTKKISPASQKLKTCQEKDETLGRKWEGRGEKALLCRNKVEARVYQKEINSHLSVKHLTEERKWTPKNLKVTNPILRVLQKKIGGQADSLNRVAGGKNREGKDFCTLKGVE